MVACENPDCAIEWFHFECVGLKTEVTVRTLLLLYLLLFLQPALRDCTHCKTSNLTPLLCICAACGPLVLPDLQGAAFEAVIILLLIFFSECC
jgi:hypothetical protein